MTRDQIADVCAQAMGTPIETRAWIAALVLAVEGIDDEWRRGAVYHLLKQKGKLIYEQK
jgi:hypothetical protein